MKINGRKTISALLIFASLTALLTIGGCGQQQAQPKKDEIVVGFSQLGNESAWREQNTRSLEEAAEAADYKLIVKNGLQKQENQIKAIRSFIASQVDVIVLAPIVESGWDTVLAEAAEARIPVILSDREIDGDSRLYQTVVGTDGIGEGKKAANFLLKKYADHKGPLRIAEITGTPGSSSAEMRAEGFREGLAVDPRFEIITSANGDYMLSKGEEVIRQVDEAFDLHTIDILFSHNDDMTLGILQYLQETDIQPGKDITIVSVDAQQKVVDLVEAGSVNCTVECNPNSGPKLVTVINHLLNGGELEPHYYLDEQVISETTDFATLSPRGY